MPLPPFALVQRSRTPAPGVESAARPVPAPAPRVEIAPAGVPPGASFDLGARVLRTFLALVVAAPLGCGTGPEARQVPTPAGPGLTCDVDRLGARLVHGRERVAYWQGWTRYPAQLAPGPRVDRRSQP